MVTLSVWGEVLEYVPALPPSVLYPPVRAAGHGPARRRRPRSVLCRWWSCVVLLVVVQYRVS